MIESWALILAAAFVASTVAAIAGTGGGVILLPVLVGAFGVRQAVPIYAIAQLIGNLSRVGFNWKLIDRRAVLWFCAGAVPFGIAGSWLFTRLPDYGLLRLLGGFLILSVVARHIHPAMRGSFRPVWFAPIGAVFSTISGILGSAGPFLAPFYLGYGLSKGAFIGTEALGTAVMHVAKLSAYQGLGAVTESMWISGLLIGPVMICGSFTGKKILDRIPHKAFMILIEITVLGFGLYFLVK